MPGPGVVDELGEARALEASADKDHPCEGECIGTDKVGGKGHKRIRGKR